MTIPVVVGGDGYSKDDDEVSIHENEQSLPRAGKLHLLSLPKTC